MGRGDGDSAGRTPGVRLRVADDGVGIPEGGRRSGLGNLERRAESLGGDTWHGWVPGRTAAVRRWCGRRRT